MRSSLPILASSRFATAAPADRPGLAIASAAPAADLPGRYYQSAQTGTNGAHNMIPFDPRQAVAEPRVRF